jgi:hypothetical protein
MCNLIWILEFARPEEFYWFFKMESSDAYLSFVPQWNLILVEAILPLVVQI